MFIENYKESASLLYLYTVNSSSVRLKEYLSTLTILIVLRPTEIIMYLQLPWKPCCLPHIIHDA